MLQFLVEVVFHTVCGWIGSTSVKVLTFGRVQLDWGDGCSESVLAEWIGLLALVGLSVSVLVWWPAGT
jgi:hypothetical protein